MFCISHPAQQNWRILRGTTCRVPFEIETNDDFTPDMLIFDHGAQIFVESSGAPIIDLMGKLWVCNSLSEFRVDDRVRLLSIDTYRNVSQLARQV